ncbi:hypothetical protein DL767_000640 [Monosporascus sp. MG133]|nr:hypothetical protein DL767_000640 [Monosporascus sp. MG133]
MENVRGSSIRELCFTGRAATLDKAYRLGILARVLHGYAIQLLKGLNQRDLASRNVIVGSSHNVQPGTQQQQTFPRLVLVDYNIAFVYKRTMFQNPHHQNAKLPPNHMELFWKDKLVEFRSWIPSAWEAKPRQRQEWLNKRFRETNAANYEILREKLEFAN